jgi:hypothetical protein
LTYTCAADCAYGYLPEPGCPGLNLCECNPPPSSSTAQTTTTSTSTASSSVNCSNYYCIDNCAFGHAPQAGCPGTTTCACNPSPLDGGPDASSNDPRCPAMWTYTLAGTTCTAPGVTCTYGTGVLSCTAPADGGASVWN